MGLYRIVMLATENIKSCRSRTNMQLSEDNMFIVKILGRY